MVHIFKYRTVRKWIMKRDVHTHTHTHTYTECLPYSAPGTEALKGCPRRYRLSNLSRCYDQGDEKTGILCVCVSASTSECIPYSMYIILLHYDAWLNCHYVIK